MDEPLIGQGFSLVMQLRTPAEMEPLLRSLATAKKKINKALNTLDYVHSARFLPIFSHGLLLIVTEFDGVDKDYVMDFAALLDDEFSLILSYMKDAPPLPVSRYPNEFWDYVYRNTRSPFGKFPDVFMPYPDKAVIDIVGAKRAKELPPPRERGEPVQLEDEDLQANIVDGYHGTEAVHVRVRFASAEKGQAFLADLLSDEATLRVTTGKRWEKKEDKPAYCLNIGFTYEGLATLGVAYDVLRRFPQAFVEGPLARAEKIGDIGNNDPKNWQAAKAGPDGKPLGVHAMISLYARDKGDLGTYEKRLDKLLAKHEVVEAFDDRLRGALLTKPDNVHFGYRDGLSLPKADPAGDFILGADRVNSRGGTFIGSLPEALARNGTYGALRVIEQDTVEFDKFIARAADKNEVDPEWIAAKLMGRWRDGSPLALHPDKPDPDIGKRGPGELDEFDYVKADPRGEESRSSTGEASEDESAQASVNDFEGLRCPVGAHIRRFNPRHGLVLGVPWGRRVLRRGMPYGKEVDSERPRADGGEKRGLIGMFYCGDLESQYEFLLKVWANQDVSAAGLRGSREPFVGSRPGPTPFVIHRKDKPPIKLEVPVLTTCRGSLYLFVPGIDGLRWLAGGRKTTREAPSIAAPKVVTWFDPADPSFHVDPYPFYAAFRAREREGAYLAMIGGAQQSYWVFGHGLVRQVTDADRVFQKPGKDRDKGPRRNACTVAAQFGDGLFFMDRPRHSHVRSMMEDALEPNVRPATIEPGIRQAADRLLGAMAGRSTCEFVGDYAAQLPMQIFMSVMGIPADDVQLVDIWVRTALKGHDRSASPAEQGAGATASMALRSYFSGLQLEMSRRKEAGTPSVLEAMKKCTGPGETDSTLSPFEAVNTAIQFALGGYLSTQFLIASGVYTLLSNPEQWEALRDDRSLLDRAVTEMLRYEAPFQIADRWVADDTELNGFALKKGDKLAVVYGSANRDDAVFADPDRFQIERNADEKDVFGFGNGIHRCIGAPLAPVVARVALEALLDHYPFARLGPAGPWSTDPYFRSLSQLTLLLG